LARIFALTLAMSLAGLPAAAQDERRIFVGGVFGGSSLSADGRSVAAARHQGPQAVELRRAAI
jgi:hypothetical protein